MPAFANLAGLRFGRLTVLKRIDCKGPVRFLSLGIATPMKRLIEQHRNIVSAMREHLRDILLALPQLAEANPDIFEDRTIPEHTVHIIKEMSH